MSIATIWADIKATVGGEVTKGEAYLKIEEQEALVTAAKLKIAAVDAAHAAHTAIIASYEQELLRVGADAVKIKAALEALLAKL